MNTSMIRHGIHNTTATYWVHYHPLEKIVYWYRVDLMLRFVKREKLPETIGRSKNGQETGIGYLVPKSAFFIIMDYVAPSYDDGVNWPGMSDREAGLLGESIVEALVEHRVVKFPAAIATRKTEQTEQFQATDFEYSWFRPFSFEVKTERIISQNLFVQTGERGHAVNLIKSGDNIVERITEAEWDK